MASTRDATPKHAAPKSGRHGARGCIAKGGIGVAISCLLVLGAMILMLTTGGVRADSPMHAFVGTWSLSGTARGDSVDHNLDGTRLELREDGTASYVGHDATSLLAPDTGTTATWGAETPGMGTVSMNGNTFMMTIDGGRLTLETADGTLVFVRDTP